MFESEITDIFKKLNNRYDIVKELKNININNFILAGSSMSNHITIKDLDIFITDIEFNKLKGNSSIPRKYNSTKLINLKINGINFQIIKSDYDLINLINSFHFSSTQVGINYDNGSIISYCTEDYLKYLITKENIYTGSNYPLASLITLTKYFNKGNMSRLTYNKNCVDILIEIITRGFKDYDDFKDQLSSIDLVLEDEELRGPLFNLFNLLNKGK
jgi:hypothetical protein